MNNINRSLKIFSVLMLLTFFFSVAVFAEPETDTQQNKLTDDEVITATVTENVTDEPETEAPNTTEPSTTQTVSVKTTVTQVRTTRSRPSTTKKASPTTTQAPKKSDNADLSSLSVIAVLSDGRELPLTITPQFSSDSITYGSTLSSEAVLLKVSANAKSDKASVEIPPEFKPVNGDNVIKVTVTAEDATEKIYEISVKYTVEETTSTAASTTLPQITQAANIQQNKGKINTYTKLGIVFAVGGAALLGISVYLFFKRND